MKRFLVALLIPLALLASEVGDYLSSEEEILNALASDEINFTQYYDLVELFREKVSIFTDDIDVLLIVPGVDKRWTEALRRAVEKAGPYASPDQIIQFFPYDFDRIEPFIIFDKPTRRDWRAGTKIYTHGRFIDSDPYYPKTYFTADARYKAYTIDLRMQEDQNGFAVKRRKLELKLFDGELALGSYREGFGPGMVLGKAFYIPGGMRSNSTGESFANPQDNLFNGFRYERESDKIAVGALASRILYDEICANVVGMHLGWNPIEEMRVGGVYAFASTNSRPAQTAFKQSSGSIFAMGDINGVDVETELGFVENGAVGFMASAVAKIGDTRTLTEVWTYADDFNPLNAMGISDYKQTIIELDESGVIQRSREAGESGFEIRTTSALGENLFFNTKGSGWRTAQIDEWGVLSEVGLYFRPAPGKRLRGDYTYDKRIVAGAFREKQAFRLSLNWPIFEHLDNSTYMRVVETRTGNTPVYGISVYPEFIYSRFEPMVMRLRVKRYKSDVENPENGYWELRLRDEIRTGPILWIAEIRYAVYDKTAKDPLTEFRITSAYYWR